MKKNHTTMSQIKSQEMHLLSKCYECYKTISSKKQSEHSKTVDFLFKRLQFMAKGGRQIRRFCSAERMEKNSKSYAETTRNPERKKKVEAPLKNCHYLIPFPLDRQRYVGHEKRLLS